MRRPSVLPGRERIGATSRASSRISAISAGPQIRPANGYLATLERIDASEAHDLRQFVQRAPAFVEQGRIAEIGGAQSVSVMAIDPGGERRMQAGVEPHVCANGLPLRRTQAHAKPQARRPAAVAHALPQIENAKLAYRPG